VDEETVRSTLPVGPRGSASGTLAAQVDEFERRTIESEIERSRHNLAEAARALGLERSHLYKKCAQLGIDLKKLRRSDG
jgi:two-component system, NtrC family, nitrogen regulation response regulator NtrX